MSLHLKVLLDNSTPPKDDNELTTKKYVDDAIENGAKKFTVNGDAGKGFEISDTLTIKGKNENITTEADSNNVLIKLSENLTGINKIEFKDNKGSKLVIGSDGITGLKAPTKDNDAVNKKYVDDNKVTVDGDNSYIKVDKNNNKYTVKLDKDALDDHIGTKFIKNDLSNINDNGKEAIKNLTEVDGKDGIVVSKITEGDKQKFIVKLDENTNNSIKNSLSKTEAEKIYAKLDASNLDDENKTKWRDALKVYTKEDVDAKFGGEVSEKKRKL